MRATVNSWMMLPSKSTRQVRAATRVSPISPKTKTLAASASTVRKILAK